MPGDALRILFPTNFSDACDRAARAIAPLASASRLDLTIVHVAKPGRRTTRAGHELERFLFDAHYYGDCRRLVIEADDAAEAVGQLAHTNAYDLVMAPASNRPVVHRLLTRSFRGQLMTRCRVPLWTAGESVIDGGFERPIRRVACLMDFDADRKAFVRLVTSFAAKFNAAAHFLYVVPPVDEGMLTHAMTSAAPLTPSLAVTKIREMFAEHDRPEIDVAVGGRGAELRRMLARCDADLLFVGPRHAASGAWALRIARDLDRLPCPVICVDGAAAGFARWSFHESTTWPQVPHRTVARHEAPATVRRPSFNTGWPSEALVRR